MDGKDVEKPQVVYPLIMTCHPSYGRDIGF